MVLVCPSLRPLHVWPIGLIPSLDAGIVLGVATTASPPALSVTVARLPSLVVAAVAAVAAAMGVEVVEAMAAVVDMVGVVEAVAEVVAAGMAIGEGFARGKNA